MPRCCALRMTGMGVGRRGRRAPAAAVDAARTAAAEEAIPATVMHAITSLFATSGGDAMSATQSNRMNRPAYTWQINSA